MNFKQLESFRLSDAVKFHDNLNPKLWVGNKLRPEVSKQLKLISEDFLDEMGIHNLDVVDITISGSNAAYSYTKYSDIDLHILLNFKDLPDDEVYTELFNAKKTLYNDTHDIKIYGTPVELYVQDINQPHITLGEYSVLQGKWLKVPTKRRANFDQISTKLKYEKLYELIVSALKTKKLEKINKTLDKIKQYRKAGLDKGGEFSPENIAYKALRNRGILTRLFDMRDKLHSEYLTIENMYQNPVQEDETLRFASERTPAINPYGGLKDRQYRGSISEASGYIPSEKEKNDPRFKTALTVDVRPNTMKKDAKKFGNKISRAGIPPTSNPNGKF